MTRRLTIFGDKLYQQRARQALPLLVRQAHAEQPIPYGALARELGMANPRTLNYPLSAIGYELARLNRRWPRKIPPLQLLVHNARSGVPGRGVYGFVGHDGTRLGLRHKRIIMKRAHDDIFVFPLWNAVLTELGLRSAPLRLPPAALLNIPVPRGGESAEHRALKRFVATHPDVVGLAGNSEATMEYRLASGDCVDVLFRTKELHFAVEVKADGVPQLEVVRGFFQCTKYQAVLAAMNAYASLAIECRSMLVLGGGLPKELIPLSNALGVPVKEHVRAR